MISISTHTGVRHFRFRDMVSFPLRKRSFPTLSIQPSI